MTPYALVQFASQVFPLDNAGQPVVTDPVDAHRDQIVGSAITVVDLAKEKSSSLVEPSVAD